MHCALTVAVTVRVTDWQLVDHLAWPREVATQVTQTITVQGQISMVDLIRLINRYFDNFRVNQEQKTKR